MKRPKSKKPGSRRFALIERNLPFTKIVRFPQMKGRTIEKIEFFTDTDYHEIAIRFQDGTLLTLGIEPCFLLDAEFSDATPDSLRVIKEWPAIHSLRTP